LVADEWHDLMGSKRGVQLELALSRLYTIAPELRVWGISATIGNLEQAMEVLLGSKRAPNGLLIKSGIKKKLEVISLMPKEIEKMPWAGHIGIKLLDQVVEVIQQNKSTLVFTNTRAQCEIWYQAL